MVHSPEWSIVPREKNLARLYDPLSKWSRLHLVERHNSPDTWTVTGPANQMLMFGPGTGCILDRGEKQITSGKVTNIERFTVNENGRMADTLRVSFASDLMPLGHRIIFPDPSFNLTTAVSQFPSSYDLRSGAIETLIIGYIRSHIGDLAQADRRLPRLRVPASLSRGGTTQVSARLDNLGVLVRDLAETGNLRVTIKHTEDAGGAWLDLVIDEVQDKSDDIRFGTGDSTATGIITDWAYQIGMPTATRAIVAGGGELSARDFLEVDDLVAESLWGGAVEFLIDQRQIAPASADKTAELTRAATEALEAGAGPVSVTFTPKLGPDLEYRRDVNVGDIVGYDLPGLEPAQDKIREATTVVTVEQGRPTETVSVLVGTPDAPLTRDQQQTARALRAINVLRSR